MLNDARIGQNRDNYEDTGDGKSLYSLNITGFTSYSLGDDSYRKDNSYSFVDDFSYTRGRHTIKAWPVVTLYLDIKNDPPEHLQAILKVLDKYPGWLTAAKKTADIAVQSPLDLKPMMVLVEDKQNDIKQQFFYDQVRLGGKIRVFGTVPKFDENPTHLPSDKKAEAIALLSTFEPEQPVPHKADNYHRWFGANWAFIEKAPASMAGHYLSAATRTRAIFP